MAECPIYLGDPAVNMVSLAYDKYTDYATQAYKLATRAVDDLQDYPLTPYSFRVNWAFDDSIYGYVRPTAPQAPSDLDYRSPGSLPAPPTAQIDDAQFDAAPKDPGATAPALREYTAPGSLQATRPGSAPTLKEVPTVSRNIDPLPTVPTLRELNLPDAPDVTFTPFTGVRPAFDIEAPLENFGFTPEQYTSDLLSRVQGRVSCMLDGGTGLPASIAQALRDRAYSAVDQQERRAVQTAVDEFALMGWTEPNGQLAKRLAGVRQNNQNQRNSLSRDLAIRDQELAIENLRFAVTQGIALESALMSDHMQLMQLGMQAAEYAQDLRIRVFDARVSLANMELQAYQTDAQVWRDQLQGELVKLQAYREELEGVRIQGDLNEQDVRIYSERLRGILAQVDIYRADIEGARLVSQQNRDLIDNHRAEIAAYSEEVQAWRTEWDGYRSQLETNNVRANLFQLTEQAYATRVGAWRDQQQQKIAQQQLSISKADLSLRGWEGGLRKLQSDIEAERTRLNAVNEAFRSRVTLFQSQASVEAVASDANLRKFTAGVEAERQRTDVALKNAELDINQLVEIARISVAKQQAVAQTSSQLAASSMSAVNFSAGVSSRRSESQTCNTSFSYSGNLDDSSNQTS